MKVLNTEMAIQDCHYCFTLLNAVFANEITLLNMMYYLITIWTYTSFFNLHCATARRLYTIQ